MPPTAKKQKIASLTQREFALQRTEVFYGSKIPSAQRIPIWDDARRRFGFYDCSMSTAARRIAKEAFDNAVDNAARGGMTYIRAAWKDGALVLSNDGSTPPVEQEEDGTWIPTAVFSRFQTGSNFDDDEGGKEVASTAGMNGLGSKGLNVFATEFSVVVNDGAKVFAQTWTESMGKAKAPRVRDANAKEQARSEVRITWKPDFALLNTTPDALERLCSWYAFTAALCTPADIRVTWNNRLVGLRTPQDLCKALGGEAPFAKAEGEGFALCVAPRGAECAEPDGDVLASGGGVALDFGFVNGTPCAQGTHAKHVLGAVCGAVLQKARAKNADAQVTPSFVAKHAVTVLVCTVPNPRFESQAKEVLKTNMGELGWRLEPPADFVSALVRGPLVAAAVEAARERGLAEASKLTRKTARGLAVAKHERAHELGKGKATLFVTEGDSAKNFAVAGISVVGRKHYGVYPIRGKFVNVRGMDPKSIAQNKEASELLRILGVQLGHAYTREEALKLPYRWLTILSDQDVDGSHIAGLLLNFVAVCAPSLLVALPDFVCRFATALIRVPRPGGRPDLAFFTEEEYRRARDAGQAPGKPRYYKGLGTSSNAEAKAYFRNLEGNTLKLLRTDAGCDALDLFFNGKRTQDRKEELERGDVEPLPALDYSLPSASYDDFVRRELLPSYARASIERAIVQLEDGLKPSSRKALFAARKLLREPLSVANAAGKFAALTHYHHRGTAMEGTIVNMAINYAGAPNLNLFKPLGQFGSRHSHTPASAAYPKIALESVGSTLYPAADAAVLDYVVDEGAAVEPEMYVSVIPAVLCNGGKGIATGWRTEIPQFKPRDLVDCCMLLARSERGDAEALGAFEKLSASLRPWYRGFTGTVEPACKGGWNVVGRYERRGADVHVLDVPPMRETDAYKEDWLKSYSVLEGSGHTDESVHLIVHDLQADDVVDALGLSKRVSFDNAYLLCGERKIPRLFASARDVLLEHKAARLRLYEKRLEHDRGAALKSSSLAADKARFVASVIQGEFPPLSSFEDDAALCAALSAHGFRRDSDDPDALKGGEYGYLLKMPVRSFTAARVMELNAEADASRAAHEALMQATSADVWMTEMQALGCDL